MNLYSKALDTALERRAAETVISSGEVSDEWQPLARDKNLQSSTCKSMDSKVPSFLDTAYSED